MTTRSLTDKLPSLATCQENLVRSCPSDSEHDQRTNSKRRSIVCVADAERPQLVYGIDGIAMPGIRISSNRRRRHSEQHNCVGRFLAVANGRDVGAGL